MKVIRITALIPAVFSAAACALLAILATAGTQVGQGSKYFLVSLNTSQIGSSTIRFSEANTNLTGDTTTSATTLLSSSVSNELQTIISMTGGSVNNRLQNVESSIIKDATDFAGVQDVYRVYLMNICHGNLTKSSDPTSLKIIACPALRTGGGFYSIPPRTSVAGVFVSGTTNVTVPILQSIETTFESLQGFFETASTVNFAFLTAGLVSSGLVTILSLVGIWCTTGWKLTVVTFFFAGIAPVAIFVGATITTVVIFGITWAINGIGSALTINAQRGDQALMFAWTAWGCSVISSIYWFMVWFVEARTTELHRIFRRDEDFKNWGATLRQAFENMRYPSKAWVPR